MVVAVRYSQSGPRAARADVHGRSGSSRARPNGIRRVIDTVLQRVAKAEPAALRECIDQYGGLVWSLARRFSNDDADAEDAVQEIFVNLWRSADRFDPSVASETTFVAMIARRRLIDRARHRARQHAPQALNESDPATSPPDPSQLGEEARRAGEALGRLTSDQQRVLRLAVYQGLSHDQISTATGLPLGTVKTHIRRGLIRVREMLESRTDQSAAPAGRASSDGGAR